MPTTLEQATRAKIVLKFRLGRPEWLRGIGVSLYDLGLEDHERKANDDYCIKVNVREATPEVLAYVPDQVDGVPVLVDLGRPSRGPLGLLADRCHHRCGRGDSSSLEDDLEKIKPIWLTPNEEM